MKYKKFTIKLKFFHIKFFVLFLLWFYSYRCICRLIRVEESLVNGESYSEYASGMLSQVCKYACLWICIFFVFAANAITALKCAYGETPRWIETAYEAIWIEEKNNKLSTTKRRKEVGIREITFISVSRINRTRWFPSACSYSYRESDKSI